MKTVEGTTLTAYAMTAILADRNVAQLQAALLGDPTAIIAGDIQLSSDNVGPFWAATEKVVIDLNRLAEIVKVRQGQGVVVSQCGDEIHITCGSYTEKPWIDWDEKVLFWSPAPERKGK